MGWFKRQQGNEPDPMTDLVFGNIENFSGLAELGEKTIKSDPDLARDMAVAGLGASDIGAARLCGWMREYFVESHHYPLWVKAMQTVRSHAQMETGVGSRSWGIVENFLTEIAVANQWRPLP